MGLRDRPAQGGSTELRIAVLPQAGHDRAAGVAEDREPSLKC